MKYYELIRAKLQDHLKAKEWSLRKVAGDVGINYQILYRFAEKDGGMNGINTILLLDYLGIEVKDLNKWRTK